MTNLMNYLWEGMICLTVLWLFYKVFLERNTFFGWNRAFLLSSLIIALIFPALNLPGIRDFNLVNESLIMQLPAFEFEGSSKVQNTSPTFSLSYWVFVIYLTGLLVVFTRFLLSIVAIVVQTRKARITYRGKYKLMEHPSFEPSSFFHFIFLPEGALQWQQKVDWIIAHEATHAKYGHSLDKLLLQVIKIVFWFYPIHLMYEKALEVLHEYQVDEQMTQNYPLKAYASLLINLAKPKTSSLLVHNFNQFQIKKRITMMTQPKSKWMARSIYPLVLPLIASLFVLVSCEEQDEMNNEVYDVVEDMPEPMGGFEGWMEYLSSNLKYPQTARDLDKEGTVFLEFIVTKDGKLEKHEVIRGVAPELDSEALRVLKNSPDWTPGQQDGQNMNVRMRIPIRFKLDN